MRIETKNKIKRRIGKTVIFGFIYGLLILFGLCCYLVPPVFYSCISLLGFIGICWFFIKMEEWTRLKGG